MPTFLFLTLMAVWLVAIAAACLAARGRLRQDDQNPERRAAVLVAMTRIPCIIPVGDHHEQADA
jgi:hypothetical protein